MIAIIIMIRITTAAATITVIIGTVIGILTPRRSNLRVFQIRES